MAHLNNGNVAICHSNRAPFVPADQLTLVRFAVPYHCAPIHMEMDYTADRIAGAKLASHQSNSNTFGAALHPAILAICIIKASTNNHISNKLANAQPKVG